MEIVELFNSAKSYLKEKNDNKFSEIHDKDNISMSDSYHEKLSEKLLLSIFL